MENIEATSTKFGVLGIETDVLYQWRTLVPTYEERLTTIRGIHVLNVKIGKTSTPFRILGDEKMPVKDVSLENITIDNVHGQRSRYEHVDCVTEKNVRVRAFIEEADAENKNE
jgi:hypothetical protein